jgi:OmpA-OmpF porin, OOP family
MIKFKNISIVLITLFTSVTLAHSAETKGGYFGVSLGAAEVTYANTTVSNGATLDGEDTSFKIFGGFNLHENFALEAAYVDFGEATVTMPTGGVLTVNGVSLVTVFGTGVITSTADTLAFSGVVKGDVGIAELFAKVGMHMWDSELTSNFINLANSTSSGTDLFFGFGADFGIADNLALRLEYENYTFGFASGDDEIDILSFGGILRF